MYIAEYLAAEGSILQFAQTVTIQDSYGTKVKKGALCFASYGGNLYVPYMFTNIPAGRPDGTLTVNVDNVPVEALQKADPFVEAVLQPEEIAYDYKVMNRLTDRIITAHRLIAELKKSL